MGEWISDEELAQLKRGDGVETDCPVPTFPISNGEFSPHPRTDAQREVEKTFSALADEHARARAVDRRAFLKSSASFATAFLAMNAVYGEYFEVSAAEATGAAAPRDYANQFIFDVHLHFAQSDRSFDSLLNLRRAVGGQGWDPQLAGAEQSSEKLYFRNFMKEVFFDSDTTMGIVTNAPAHEPEDWFVTNDAVFDAKRLANETAGSTRLLGQWTIQPHADGWLEDIDRGIEEFKPDSWKGYTIGSPGTGDPRYAYRLDDEELMYPAYERMARAGVRNVCIHKGLVPNNYREALPDRWIYAAVEDVPKAARDWPQLNFVIYHAAMSAFTPNQEKVDAFERTGRIEWVSELAEIPERYGVNNVYCDVGAVFGLLAAQHPRLAAGMTSILVRGLGADKIFWGTDSIWFGSPQWQIEALRRLELPDELQKKFDLPALGPGDGPVKSAILGRGAAAVYGIDPDAQVAAARGDALASAKRRYRETGEDRSNVVYGLIPREI